jgi:hypothetical protein
MVEKLKSGPRRSGETLRRGPMAFGQLAAAPAWLNVELTFCPSVVTTVMQAIRMSASITAYSTAVGPSSLMRNRRIFAVR